jgi:hypothetical protein
VVRKMAGSDHWPLRLNTEMRTRFLVGGFDRPAAVEAVQHIAWRGICVGAQEGFELASPIGIADQYLQDRHDRLAGVMPQCRAGGIFDPALATPGRSAGLDNPLPSGCGIGDAR